MKPPVALLALVAGASSLAALPARALPRGAELLSWVGSGTTRRSARRAAPLSS